MNRKFISWLSFLAVFTLMLHSCRNDYLPEQSETYNNSSEFQLTSQRISLSQSKHKAKLLPELQKVEAQLKAKNGALSKVVNYGNGVSIDTDDVIYIENGPNYHTYTFHIKKENAPADAPLENLVLSPLSDGSYKEFLITYHLTQQEKENIGNGHYFYSGNNTSIIELAPGTYNGNNQLAKQSCGWETRTGWNRCSSNHHDGSNFMECEYLYDMTHGYPPTTYTYSVYSCIDIDDDSTMPSNPGGGGGGSGGGGSCEGCSSNPNDCVTAPTDQQSPSTGFTDENGCLIGIPTLPNLPPRNNPCEKTKALLTNPEVKEKLDSLKNKSLSKGEIGFKTTKDGTVTGYISGGKHEVDLGVKAGYQGGYHNHTPTGIPMHSPPDIDNNLLSFARAQPTGEHKNAYFGMIVKKACTSCPSGFRVYHYIIRFDGDYSDALTSFSQSDLDKLNTEYSIKESKLSDPTGSYGSTYIDSLTGNLTNEGLEVLFFETVKKMGLTNKIILQRIEDNGTVNNITLNPDGLHTTATPCI